MSRRSADAFVLGVVIATLVGATYLNSPLFDFGGTDFGHFSGNARLEFVNEGEGAGRDMLLLEDLTYTDPNGGIWTAPAGIHTDGASIPPAFWSIVGGPFEGKYRDAAIIHDHFTDVRTAPWQDVHRVFYYASLANGVGSLTAKILYAAVLAGGPRWTGGASNCYAACHAMPPTVEILPDGGYRYLVDQAEADRIVRWITDNDPPLTDIEAEFPAPH